MSSFIAVGVKALCNWSKVDFINYSRNICIRGDKQLKLYGVASNRFGSHCLVPFQFTTRLNTTFLLTDLYGAVRNTDGDDGSNALRLAQRSLAKGRGHDVVETRASGRVSHRDAQLRPHLILQEQQWPPTIRNASFTTQKRRLRYTLAMFSFFKLRWSLTKKQFSFKQG